VGGGRDRATDGLNVDVAEVRHGQAEAIELPVEVGEHGAASHPYQPAFTIGVDHAGYRVDVEQQVVGEYRRREGVAGSGNTDLTAGGRGGADQFAQLGDARRSEQVPRMAGLISRPVFPGLAHATPPGCSAPAGSS